MPVLEMFTVHDGVVVEAPPLTGTLGTDGDREALHNPSDRGFDTENMSLMCYFSLTDRVSLDNLAVHAQVVARGQPRFRMLGSE